MVAWSPITHLRLQRNAAGSGWTVMHGALIAHLLIHLRSQPIAQWVSCFRDLCRDLFNFPVRAPINLVLTHKHHM